jgi:16S rRNA pseudouridine516 synthase
MVRVDRLLANRGYCARSAVGGFLRSHLVFSGQKRVESSATRVHPPEITIDGEPIDPGQLFLLLNKPAGTICSHREAGRRVYELFPERWRRREPALSTVGRLDADTTGALILTDDGSFLHRLTSPRRHVPRVYLAALEKPLQGDESRVFGEGTLILDGDDKPLLPAELEQINDRTVRLTLHEGRYHQVKRMFAAVGNRVLTLHRERFGPLGVEGLAPGQWRPLAAEEICLFEARQG